MNRQIEYVKCYKDKSRIKFIETFLSTYNADERKEIPFKLFPRQKVFLQSLVNNSNTIAIKHRQCGVTTISSAWVTGQLVFASSKSPETVLCIGNKLDISEQLIEKICNFLDQVPRWMWGNDFYSPDPENEKNKKSIYKARNKHRIELFNGCKVYARSSGENAARGISAVSILIFDEAAFIQNGISVYAQAVAATASVNNAKIIMVSTPNGKDQLYYRTYSKALKKENNYNPVEFKWYQDLRYNRNLKWYRKNEENGNIEYNVDPVIGKRGEIEYNEQRWKELECSGWTPTSPWYVDMCKTFNNDEQKIAQELNVSFLGSSDNVVPVEVIEAHLNQNVRLIDDKWELKDKYVKETWIWKKPIEEHRYICSCDTSSGSGEDRTAIEIFDVDGIDINGMPIIEQVLEYNGKKTGDEIGGMIYQYAMTYNTALVVVEDIGGYGSATILTLLSMKYPNLYYDDPSLKTYTVQRKYSDYSLNAKTDKLPGFHTSNVRFQMISNFVGMLKDNTFIIRSIRVINELETWIFKNGRPDHMDGCHDDSLTCLAMGLFVMQFSMLKHEKDKSKDKFIINSWMVTKNDSSSNKLFAKNNIDICDNRAMPIYSSKQFEDRKKSRFNAMLLLGGINVNKKI